MTFLRGAFAAAMAVSGLFVCSFSASGEAQTKKPAIQVQSSATCRECHSEIYDGWKKAMHSMSFDDPIFKAAYMESYFETQGQAKFDCLPCHAPITRLNQDYDLKDPVTREGNSCDFCHRVKEVHLGEGEETFRFETGRIKRGPLSNVTSPAHDTQQSPLFTSSEFCAGCHEYTNAHGLKVLATYSEWKGSSFAAQGVQCQDCHMPLIDGNTVKEKVKAPAQKKINLHAISVSHSAAQLRKAVRLDLKKASKEGGFVYVEVSLTNIGSGHSVPTGLPSRTLVLWVELKSPGKFLSQRRVYQRILKDDQGREPKKPYEIFQNTTAVSVDNRLRPGETRLESFVFAAPESKDIQVTARLEYVYQVEVMSSNEMRVQMAESTRVLK